MLNTLEVIDTDRECKVFLDGKELPHVTESNSPTGEIGCSKSVFVSDDYVVKVGTCTEAKFEPEAEDRKHFAEVVYADIDMNWYVQKRVNCLPNAPFTPEQGAKICQLAQKYRLEDVYTVAAEEDEINGGVEWTHNWIPDINGVPVIFDYDF